MKYPIHPLNPLELKIKIIFNPKILKTRNMSGHTHDENVYKDISQYIQVDNLQTNLCRTGKMTLQKPCKNSGPEKEPDNGPYFVQLSQDRKVRSCFELKKGKFFRTDTVAEILDVEPEVIRELIRRKELSAIKIGKSYRITERDLQEFLNARYTRKKTENNETGR